MRGDGPRASEQTAISPPTMANSGNGAAQRYEIEPADRRANSCTDGKRQGSCTPLCWKHFRIVSPKVLRNGHGPDGPRCIMIAQIRAVPQRSTHSATTPFAPRQRCSAQCLPDLHRDRSTGEKDAARWWGELGIGHTLAGSFPFVVPEEAWL